MNKPVLLSIFLFSATLSYAQVYIGCGYNYFPDHSENQQPRVFDGKIEDSFIFTTGYNLKLSGARYMQFEFGYYSIDRPVFNEPDHFISDSFSEANYTFSPRIYWSSNGLIGYGIGPILGLIDQTVDVKTKSLDPRSSIYDQIYIYSAGIGAVARLGYPVWRNWFVLGSLQYEYLWAFRFESGGQDLSDYEHWSSSLSVNVGLGYRITQEGN